MTSPGTCSCQEPTRVQIHHILVFLKMEPEPQTEEGSLGIGRQVMPQQCLSYHPALPRMAERKGRDTRKGREGLLRSRLVNPQNLSLRRAPYLKHLGWFPSPSSPRNNLYPLDFSWRGPGIGKEGIDSWHCLQASLVNLVTR